ncbi:hypothetical protein TCAL_03788 [Tigriopus californicus]|uniref:Galactosylgalactosylxylosylprotein 3-beta-glucuronosyltransferase n=2 Tax=Tigriopus californicus TaxID=6832 RepID=A0A553NVH7_TIGCA|nr:galactosylgalactosylxylosylprotein 3-beta-glucuronosyltransferase I-like isoform X2 [Tigriopus californicus]TRY69432.1 hypothetical protein TCAL_03788 [Tigriopus californicus]|eukprot:TCALIF_03788-PA protein Name:"Similar to B3gat3 Galactosylgalactosylxylosylprotein 3-beta-glucuronosyltransferase 3 (Mus musculus)" AED:0.11 eAED:0.11 QI:0/-1/0/1/-1/1/1/0/343
MGFLAQIYRSRWWRYLQKRKPGLLLVLIFAVFLIYFNFIDPNRRKSDVEYDNHQLVQSELVRLRSQIGFLKAKLAAEGRGITDLNDLAQPMIYAITPTYARPVQKAELIRLCHTFLLVPNFHWIVVEDAAEPTDLVTNLLKRCGVVYTQLKALTPPEMKLKPRDPNWRYPRGVWQRNEALTWIRNNVPVSREGVVYFADDDNTYSLELFQDLRSTKAVSVFPVALVGGVLLEKPEVSPDGRVIGFNALWEPQRPYPIDMAGFAVNLQLILAKSEAKFSLEVKRGYLESEFIGHLISGREELEAKADLCTKVLVWHTRAEAIKTTGENIRKRKGLPMTNVGFEI